MVTRTSILGWSMLTMVAGAMACESNGAPAVASPADGSTDAGTRSGTDAGDDQMPPPDGSTAPGAGDDQTPPQGAAKVKAWLEKGAYKTWRCESEVHASRSPSPHGPNRICSNDVLSANAAGTGDWPAGSAAVKELYARLDQEKIVGYSVYLKTKADSAAGANWYWYEVLPAPGNPQAGAQIVVADGLGDTGSAKTICVGCHAAAGTDAARTPTVGARDQVYTPVP